VSPTHRLLLRCYPAWWRDRYGEELEALIVEASGGRRVPWRICLDVALAGCRERLRAAALSGDGVQPVERARAGLVLTLSAWVLFVVGGAVVQKFSEQWQSATPAADRALPAAAFQVLVVGAAVGTALVLAGVCAALPGALALLRRGGWMEIRRPVVRAAVLTVAAAAVTVALVVWAHGLTSRQRNGNDLDYETLFVACGVLLVACLTAWTCAAVVTARRIDLSARVLRLEASLAVAVSVSMAAMTVATATWWAALARSAPWFLGGRPTGSGGSPLPPLLVAAAVVMLLATTAGVAGAARAVRGVRA